MNSINFFGYDFEGGYLLFGDEFVPEPGVFVVYTDKLCLEVGESGNLREALETHNNTLEWIKVAGSDDIFVAVYLEPDEESRREVKEHLHSKMNPRCK